MITLTLVLFITAELTQAVVAPVTASCVDVLASSFFGGSSGFLSFFQNISFLKNPPGVPFFSRPATSLAVLVVGLSALFASSLLSILFGAAGSDAAAVAGAGAPPMFRQNLN